MRARRTELQRYLPLSGLVWAVRLRPRILSASSDWSSGLAPLFPADRLAAFEARTGFVASRVDEVWFAGYELGLLTVVDGRHVGRTMLAEFRARALSQRPVPSDLGDLVHVTAVVEQSPRAVVEIDRHLIAFARDDVGLAREVAARAHPMVDASGALQSEWLAPVADHVGDAPVSALIVGPFEQAEDPFVATTMAVAAAARLEGDIVSVDARVLGAWPREEAESALRARLERWLSSRDARALRLDRPKADPAVECEAARPSTPSSRRSRCRIQVSFSLSDAVEGTQRVVSSELSELFD